MKWLRYILLLTAGLFIATIAIAGNTRVKGRVTDAKTGAPIAFANVVFKGTTIGISTDTEGYYALETRATVQTLCVSSLGYVAQEINVVADNYNALDFKMQPEEFTIDEVVVKSGENPAYEVLRRVVKNRERNDHRNYTCRTYTKMELDLDNIKPRFKNRRLQRNFGFIFDNMDTSVVTGKPYLPVMISEATAELYCSDNPEVTREVITASRISGTENTTFVQFTGQMHANINLYNNYIGAFNLKFASPLSSQGPAFYKYYLIDSTQVVGGRKIYKIRFHPQGVSTPVLDGEINIDSATYALQSAHIKVPKGVNLNWVNHLTIDTEYTMLNDSTWFKSDDKITAHFSIVRSDSAKITSFLGQRQVHYSDVSLHGIIPKDVLRRKGSVIVEDDALRSDEHFWDTVRPYALTAKERGIYSMVDSIRNVPMYRNIYNLIGAIFGGYYNTRYIGIGPYYKLLSFNNLEGTRFQLGGRTTHELNKRFRLSAYGAYGIKDDEFKYDAKVEIMFNRQTTRKLELGYRHDVMQLGASDNMLSESNILSSLLSRGGTQHLSMINRMTALYEHEWVHGISTKLGVELREIYANRYVPMIAPDGTLTPSIGATLATMQIRLAKDEIVIRGYYDKQYMGSDYPIVTLGLTAGIKGVFKRDYEFYRTECNIKYDLAIPPIGVSQLTLNGGAIFGHVPYLLLKLHEGNNTYFYDRYSFSCMNYYEFASDRWVSFFYEHHFNGFFLGKIPLLRRLKWRELILCKGTYGTLSDKNRGDATNPHTHMLLPEGMKSVNKPYIEAGFGIENIFKLLQVNCVWRCTHRHIPNSNDGISNFAVNVGVKLTF